MPLTPAQLKKATKGLTIEQMKKGFIVTWCMSCKKSQIMQKIRVTKGRYGIERETLYECTVCERRRKF